MNTKPWHGPRWKSPFFLTATLGALAGAIAFWQGVAAGEADSGPPREAEALCEADLSASLSSNSTRLTTDLRMYQASYSKSSWSGELRALKLKTDGIPDESQPEWKASEKIPSPNARRIFTSSGSGIGSGIEFSWDALKTAGLEERFENADVVAYLRGDQSKEGTDGFRTRSKGVLGAIVNSEIAFAGLQDFGYEALIDPSNPESDESKVGLQYLEFLRKKSERPEATSVVVVGANEGMLHGFNAASGVEEFAYVPRVLIEQIVESNPPRSYLWRLKDPQFTQRYYVDGSPWVGDAYVGGRWRTVVVGTAGAGGKGVFALGISDPDHPSETIYADRTYGLTASNVLWDLWDVDGAKDPDLGYAFGQPVVGRLKDGHFYAIFGNGRQSANGCAVLYLVRLDSGEARKINTGVCGDNGLGRPSLFDSEVAGQKGYRTTDYVYAGDLKGNLWKFNLSSTTAADWDVAIKSGSSKLPLFSAGGDRPITGGIEIGPPPPGIAMPAAMLWFGTGRYFTVAEAKTFNATQSMYGILDDFPKSGSPIDVKQLVSRAVGSTGTQGGVVQFDEKKEGAVDYKSKKGWYIELDKTGDPRERFVGFPAIKSGILLFATLRPGASCSQDTSAIFAIDPYHGRRLPVFPFVSAPESDFIVSKVGVVRSLIGVDAGKKLYLYAGGSRPGTDGSTVQFEKMEPAQQASGRGRVSWREIVR